MCQTRARKSQTKFLDTIPAGSRAEALELAEYHIGRKKPGRRYRPSKPAEREMAEWGLRELAEKKMKVVLVEAPYKKAHNGQKIRAVESANPDWYRAMFRRRLEGSPNQHVTGGFRRCVETALERVVSGWFDPIGVEGEALEEIGEEWKKEGYRPGEDDRGEEIPF